MLQKVINGNTALDKDPMDSELAQMLEFAKEKEMNYRKRDVKGYQKKFTYYICLRFLFHIPSAIFFFF